MSSAIESSIEFWRVRTSNGKSMEGLEDKEGP